MVARAVLLGRLLDLAWSQWTALGVAGSVAPARDPVDVEALMIFTAELASDDPRLCDEALDWCSRFHGFSSKPRLKQLLRRALPSAQKAFGPFGQALEHHAGRRWPGASVTSAPPRRLSGKSRLPPLTEPALFNLRLRAMFGVGARADIIGALLSHASNDFGAADLVFVGYSKRNIAEALDMLAAAELFRSVRSGNRVRFSWDRREPLSALLEPIPTRVPAWSSILRVMSGFLDLLTRIDGKSDRLSAVEAARFFRESARDLQSLVSDLPVLSATTTKQSLSDWVLSTTEQLVDTSGTSSKTPRARSRR